MQQRHQIEKDLGVQVSVCAIVCVCMCGCVGARARARLYVMRGMECSDSVEGIKREFYSWIQATVSHTSRWRCGYKFKGGEATGLLETSEVIILLKAGIKGRSHPSCVESKKTLNMPRSFTSLRSLCCFDSIELQVATK